MATLEFFRYVIGEAFDLATKYLQTKERFFQDIGGIIVIALQESKAGIANYKKTYATDQMYVARIETLMKTVDTKSQDLGRRILRIKNADEEYLTSADLFESSLDDLSHTVPTPETLMETHGIGNKN